MATRWDSSNSLSLPTRLGMDEAVPMEVDYIRGDKGKKGGKSKSKDKGKSKGKEKGKGKSEGKGSWKSGEKGKSLWEKGGLGKKGKSQEKEKREKSLEHAITVAKLDTMPRIVGAANEWHQLRRQVEELPHRQVNKDHPH